jgi:hypothetical protein
LGGAVAGASPAAAAPTQPRRSAPAESAARAANGSPAPAPPQSSTECRSPDARDILVCGQRQQPYRVDAAVLEAGRNVESNARSATSAVPAAQAACSASPMGCSKGFDSLDLANVAVVAGTMAVRAAKHKDWTSTFNTAGTDEYKLYQEAKRRREAEAASRNAARVKMKAEEEEREAHARDANLR